MGINDVFPNGLDIYDAVDLLQPVAIFVLGMAVYAFAVFKFYRFVAARDMFELDLSKYEESRYRWVRAILQVIMYLAKYIILFPIFAFLWFGVLTLILAFLSKEQAFSEILQMALATVTAIRVVAYYDEDLSRDLAKILPFAVLAIFLIDASLLHYFRLSGHLERGHRPQGDYPLLSGVPHRRGVCFANYFRWRQILGNAEEPNGPREARKKRRLVLSPLGQACPG